ncbi:MAG: hypothetical protein RLZ10_272 [Bacteroidota bacterium]|jgi:hypothetical protein
MKSLFLTVAFLSLFGFNSCKDKDPEITTTRELSEETMSYFVNYKIGTKWIYQDITNTSIYDTIELISIKPRDVNSGNGTMSKGFELYYKPIKSKDFTLKVTPGGNNTDYVKIDPLVTSAGAVTFENKNGNWGLGVIYYDSINIKGTMFNKVINSLSHSDFHAFVYYGINQGLIAFSNMNGNKNLNTFILIKTIRP